MSRTRAPEHPWARARHLVRQWPPGYSGDRSRLFRWSEAALVRPAGLSPVTCRAAHNARLEHPFQPRDHPYNSAQSWRSARSCAIPRLSLCRPPNVRMQVTLSGLRGRQRAVSHGHQWAGHNPTSAHMLQPNGVQPRGPVPAVKGSAAWGSKPRSRQVVGRQPLPSGRPLVGRTASSATSWRWLSWAGCDRHADRSWQDRSPLRQG